MAAQNINKGVTSSPQSWNIMGRVPGAFDPTLGNIPVTVGGQSAVTGDVILYRTPQGGTPEFRIITSAQFDAEFPNQP